MYRILFVDDEHFVIKGITSYINWEENGFLVPMEAYSGEQALHLLETNPVDIVVADIKMSPMDGLELMEKIKQRGYDCEIIILSCYNDFAYSRAAIQNGACDYLFKPEMMPENILAALKEAVSKLKISRSNHLQVETMREKLSENANYLKHSLLTALIDGKRMTREQLFEASQQFTLAVSLNTVHLAVIRLHNFGRVIVQTYQNDAYLFKYALENLLSEVICARGDCEYLIHDLQECLIIIDGGNNVSELKTRQNIRQIICQVFDVLGRAMDLELSCGVSAFGHPIEQLQTAYQQAISCIDQQLSSGLIVFYGDKMLNEHQGGQSVGALLEQIYQHNGMNVRQKIQQVFSVLRSKSVLSGDMLIELSINLISIQLREASLCRELIEHMYAQKGGLFANLYQLHTLDEFENYLLEISGLVSAHGGEGRMEIHNAQDYMRKHLSDSALSLRQVADYVCVSKNYFSNLFKEYTGIGFSAFLTQMRLELAEEFYCTTDLKIYQIAEKVGFSDWRYLTKVYKKNCGHNLTELKRKNSTSE